MNSLDRTDRKSYGSLAASRLPAHPPAQPRTTQGSRINISTGKFIAATRHSTTTPKRHQLRRGLPKGLRIPAARASGLPEDEVDPRLRKSRETNHSGRWSAYATADRAGGDTRPAYVQARVAGFTFLSTPGASRRPARVEWVIETLASRLEARNVGRCAPRVITSPEARINGPTQTLYARWRISGQLTGATRWESRSPSRRSRGA